MLQITLVDVMKVAEEADTTRMSQVTNESTANMREDSSFVYL